MTVDHPRPERLRVGDRVHLVSPASPPTAAALGATVEFLTSIGLDVQVGPHALDQHGYLAGTDEHRLDDINAALRDTRSRAVIATRGGKGAYRIADRLDFAAARAHRQLLVGFSEITILHLSLLRHGAIPSVHGAAWSKGFDSSSSASFHSALFTTDPVRLRSLPDEPTAPLTTSGTAHGRLIGGNQDMVATAAGWAFPSSAVPFCCSKTSTSDSGTSTANSRC